MRPTNIFYTHLFQGSVREAIFQLNRIVFLAKCRRGRRHNTRVRVPGIQYSAGFVRKGRRAIQKVKRKWRHKVTSWRFMWRLSSAQLRSSEKVSTSGLWPDRSSHVMEKFPAVSVSRSRLGFIFFQKTKNTPTNSVKMNPWTFCNALGGLHYGCKDLVQRDASSATKNFIQGGGSWWRQSVNNVVSSSTVPALYFLTVENWYKAPVRCGGGGMASSASFWLRYWKM